MKTTTKLKIWGLSQLGIAILLIVLGVIVFPDRSWNDEFSTPNLSFFVPGMFLSVLSLPIIFIGFSANITKMSAKIQSEAMDHAGEDIKVAISKTANTVIPTVTPAIKEAVSELKRNNEKTENSSKKSQLLEAKKLLDEHLISEDEYQQMRQNILGIDEK